MHVIHNGIDTETYRPAPGRARIERFGIDPARPYVLFVGRITRQKGILHLIRAIPTSAPKPRSCCAPGRPTRPRSRERSRTRWRAPRRSGQESCGSPRWSTGPTAVELYSHAAIFGCPSVYEPFGIINLEAMACETPVVATAVGGIPEVVVDGETGRLIPVDLVEHAGVVAPRDPDGFARDLAQALNALLADPSLRRTMGVKGRQRAEALFSWAAVARRTLALYRSLVAHPRGGA